MSFSQSFLISPIEIGVGSWLMWSFIAMAPLVVLMFFGRK